MNQNSLTNSKKIKDNRIVLIQYICSVLIVYIHSVNINSWSISGSDFAYTILFEKAVYYIASIAVPVFLFFSGFLMFKNYSTGNYFVQLKKRAYSLLVPYIFWNLLSYLLFAVLTRIPFIASHINFETYPIDLQFILKGLINSDFAPLWYIRNLFLYSVFQIIFYYLIKNKYIGIVSISALIIINMVLMQNDCYIEFLYWLPCFLIGAYFGLHIKRFYFERSVKPKLTACAIAMTVIYCATLIICTTGSKYSKIMMIIFDASASLLMPFIFSSIIKKDINIKDPFKISLFIYCTHNFIVRVIEKLFLIVFGVSNFSAVTCLIFTPVITIALITLIAFILKKYFNRLWLFLNGGRNV